MEPPLRVLPGRAPQAPGRPLPGHGMLDPFASWKGDTMAAIFMVSAAASPLRGAC
jgi:hypothetical protein